MSNELDLTKYEEVQFRDDWHLGLVGSDIRILIAEVKRLRAKLEAAEKQIDAMKCCHNCEYFNVVFDECEGSPDHCPTGHFEHWQPKGGE